MLKQCVLLYKPGTKLKHEIILKINYIDRVVKSLGHTGLFKYLHFTFRETEQRDLDTLSPRQEESQLPGRWLVPSTIMRRQHPSVSLQPGPLLDVLSWLPVKSGTGDQGIPFLALTCVIHSALPMFDSLGKNIAPTQTC